MVSALLAAMQAENLNVIDLDAACRITSLIHQEDHSNVCSDGLEIPYSRHLVDWTAALRCQCPVRGDCTAALTTPTKVSLGPFPPSRNFCGCKMLQLQLWRVWARCRRSPRRDPSSASDRRRTYGSKKVRLLRQLKIFVLKNSAALF
jgi:hypothetical protein